MNIFIHKIILQIFKIPVYIINLSSISYARLVINLIQILVKTLNLKMLKIAACRLKDY